ncbi:uncharacterized protein LOC126681967 [Mercurialis annua]|uniref:uncharacterized protein LOC126681967 n=1 Tax=Mercurialis annua TaxID=3986 RepID=UPI00215F5CC9|nr:uncharacterized protein LOC126681967 [Mercurialis annua]
MWQINSGMHLNPLSSPWLPDICDSLPRLNQGVQKEEVPNFISGLLTLSKSNWNEALIKHLFIPAHVQSILSLPVPYCDQPDRLIWKHHISGNYTSKSGYFQASKVIHPPISIVTLQYSKFDWQNLWLLNIYPRIKVFLWRAPHEALPIGDQLFPRCHITLKCVHCGGMESITHLLFLCPFALRVWIHQSHLYKSAVLFAGLFGRAEISCYLNKNINLSCIMHNALDAYYEYTGIIRDHMLAHSNLTNATIQTDWIPPMEGVIKVNYDAATSRDHHCGFVASIARDSDGVVIGRFHTYFRHIWDPGILELLALRESLNWAASRSWHYVIMEGDALQVSQVINSRKIIDYRTWGICQDVWCLQNKFAQCLVQYVSRQFNGLTHDLAAKVKRCYIQAL